MVCYAAIDTNMLPLQRNTGRSYPVRNLASLVLPSNTCSQPLKNMAY